MYNENNNFGIARIVLLKPIINCLKYLGIKSFVVKASRNYKFNKWEVLDIVDSHDQR